MADQDLTVGKIDVTRLAIYTRKIKELGNINKLLAPNYLRDFIEGMDVASTMLSHAIHADLKAEAKVKTAESIAYLDRAGDVLSARGLKDSAEARKMTIGLDPDVIAARDNKAKTEALVCMLKNKVQEFRCAHDDVKKFTYGENTMSNYEGM